MVAKLKLNFRRRALVRKDISIELLLAVNCILRCKCIEEKTGEIHQSFNFKTVDPPCDELIQSRET